MKEVLWLTERERETRDWHQHRESGGSTEQSIEMNYVDEKRTLVDDQTSPAKVEEHISEELRSNIMSFFKPIGKNLRLNFPQKRFI